MKTRNTKPRPEKGHKISFQPSMPTWQLLLGRQRETNQTMTTILELAVIKASKKGWA